jgi:hypothetical protein
MPNLARRPILAALALLAAGGTAFAQAGATARLRGTIIGLDGDALTIATREGGRETVTLPASATVGALRRVAMAEIVQGTALGVVAEPDADGELRAIAITVLPPGMRITERQEAWDLTPRSSMNNGAVEAVMEAADGRDVTITIFGRRVLVRINADTALVMPIPASRADLKPGAAVLASGMRGADGAFAVQRVVVARDGVAPPT